MLHQFLFRAIDGDPTHSNSISYISKDHPNVSWLKEGFLIISVRNINALAVLDPESEEIVKVFGTTTRMQHDIDYLSDGRMLIFDNRGSFDGSGFTRVLEFELDDEENMKNIWVYEGDQDDEIEFSTKFL